MSANLSPHFTNSKSFDQRIWKPNTPGHRLSISSKVHNQTPISQCNSINDGAVAEGAENNLLLMKLCVSHLNLINIKVSAALLRAKS